MSKMTHNPVQNNVWRVWRGVLNLLDNGRNCVYEDPAWE
jgi:hypothetical protein